MKPLVSSTRGVMAAMAMACLFARADAFPRAIAGALHVRFSDRPEPVVAPPGARFWVDTAATAEFEWRTSDDVASVTAVAGRDAWPFTVEAAERRARLVATDAIREAWDRAGTLTISCAGEGAVVLLSRPRRIELDAVGEDFTVPQRTAAPVPRSRGFVEVVLGDITHVVFVLPVAEE